MAESVKVRFLVHPDDVRAHGGEPFAYFPDSPASCIDPALRLCYEHLGQHGSAHPDHAAESREATEEEAAPLLAELRTIYESPDRPRLASELAEPPVRLEILNSWAGRQLGDGARLTAGCRECGGPDPYTGGEVDGLCARCAILAEGPAPDDWVTEDYVAFLPHDNPRAWGCRFVVPDPEGDWRPQLRAEMDRDRYWPNVWHVSSHGDLTLLSV